MMNEKEAEETLWNLESDLEAYTAVYENEILKFDIQIKDITKERLEFENQYYEGIKELKRRIKNFKKQNRKYLKVL